MLNDLVWDFHFFKSFFLISFTFLLKKLTQELNKKTLFRIYMIRRDIIQNFNTEKSVHTLIRKFAKYHNPLGKQTNQKIKVIIHSVRDDRIFRLFHKFGIYSSFNSSGDSLLNFCLRFFFLIDSHFERPIF